MGISIHKFKDIAVSKLTKQQLIEHAAYLIVHPLKDGGRRLLSVKKEIVRRGKL